MRWIVFYYLERAETEVSSAAPVVLSTESVTDQLVPGLEGADDFIGLIDGWENLLQVMLDADSGGYWVELPDHERRISYRRRMSRAEVVAFLRRLPARLEPAAFPDFEEHRW